MPAPFCFPCSESSRHSFNTLSGLLADACWDNLADTLFHPLWDSVIDILSGMRCGDPRHVLTPHPGCALGPRPLPASPSTSLPGSTSTSDRAPRSTGAGAPYTSGLLSLSGPREQLRNAEQQSRYTSSNAPPGEGLRATTSALHLHSLHLSRTRRIELSPPEGLIPRALPFSHRPCIQSEPPGLSQAARRERADSSERIPVSSTLVPPWACGRAGPHSVSASDSAPAEPPSRGTSKRQPRRGSPAANEPASLSHTGTGTLSPSDSEALPGTGARRVRPQGQRSASFLRKRSPMAAQGAAPSAKRKGHDSTPSSGGGSPRAKSALPSSGSAPADAGSSAAGTNTSSINRNASGQGVARGNSRGGGVPLREGGGRESGAREGAGVFGSKLSRSNTAYVQVGSSATAAGGAAACEALLASECSFHGCYSS